MNVGLQPLGNRARLILEEPCSIIVVDEPEPTALGAALLGGVAADLFPSLEAALPDLDRGQFVVEPDGTAARYEHLRTMVFADIHARMRPVNESVHAFLKG